MTTRAEPEDLIALLDRIRGEYREMPGLRLTTAQAQRLWQMDSVSCAVLLDALVDEGFLERIGEGVYTRRGAALARRRRPSRIASTG